MPLPLRRRCWAALFFIVIFCGVIEVIVSYPCRSLNGATCNVTMNDEYCYAEFKAKENKLSIITTAIGCYRKWRNSKLTLDQQYKEEFVWLQGNRFELNIYCRTNDSFPKKCVEKIDYALQIMTSDFPFEHIANVLNTQQPKTGPVNCMCEEGPASMCSALIDDFTNVSSTSEFYCPVDAKTPELKMCASGYSINVNKSDKDYGSMTTTLFHCSSNTSSFSIFISTVLRMVVKTIDERKMQVESMCIERDFCNTDNFELYFTLFLNKTLKPKSLDPVKNSFSFYLFDESKSQTLCACNLKNSSCSYTPHCVSTDFCHRTLTTKLIKSGGYDSKITTHCSRRNVAYKDTKSDSALVWQTRSVFTTTCSNYHYENCRECNNVAKSQFETFCINKRDNFVVKLWISEFSEPPVFSCICNTVASDPDKSEINCNHEGKCFFLAADNFTCQNYGREQAESSFANLCKSVSPDGRAVVVRFIYQPPVRSIMDCRFAAACNRMMGLNVFNYICPWSNDFIQSPRPAVPTMSYQSTTATNDHTLVLDCICNEGNCQYENPNALFGICTFKPGETNAVCYTRFVNLAMDGHSMTAFGCSTIDKDDERFDYRRTISLFPEGRFMFKFECRTVDECKSEDRKKEIDCFLDLKTQPYWFEDKVYNCTCQTNGMPKGFEDFCNISNSECAWSKMQKAMKNKHSKTYLLYRRNPYPAFYCSSFLTNVTEKTPLSEMKPINGCYFDFDVDELAGPIVSEIVTVSGETINFYRLTSTTFVIYNLAKLFQCSSKEDIVLFGSRSDAFGGSNSMRESPTPRKKKYIDPKEILGPVGAIVAIFMTIIVTFFVIYNLREVWKVEERWKKSEAKKKGAKISKNVLTAGSKEKSPKIPTKSKSTKDRSVGVSKTSVVEKTEKSQTDKGKSGKEKPSQSGKDKPGKSGKDKSAMTKTLESKPKTPTKRGTISKNSPSKSDASKKSKK